MLFLNIQGIPCDIYATHLLSPFSLVASDTLLAASKAHVCCAGLRACISVCLNDKLSLICAEKPLFAMLYNEHGFPPHVALQHGAALIW